MESPGRTYRHDPYTACVLAKEQSRSTSPGPSIGGDNVPTGSLHKDLQGSLNFVAYPATMKDVRVYHAPYPKELMTRIFLGQLPYGTTAQQLEWIILEVSGCPVFFTEAIHNWSGEKQSKGCAHAYCDPQHADCIIARLHRQTLIDDTGIWIAETEEEHKLLEAYCMSMKKDKTRRFFHRPCQPMVAQRAISTFVPRQAAPVGPLAMELPVYNHCPITVAPPPPSYTSWVAHN
jgi:hypothetical protein